MEGLKLDERSLFHKKRFQQDDGLCNISKRGGTKYQYKQKKEFEINTTVDHEKRRKWKGFHCKMS
jgi:hypothetical protein